MSISVHWPSSAPAACDPRERGARRPLEYARLLGADAWRRLPADVRARFASHEACWTGELTLEASESGRWVVRLLRLVGAPLPPASADRVHATVRIEPDPATGGGRWTRRYRFPRRTVEARSVKCLDPNGKLVERLGIGLYMQLDLRADHEALHFVSTGYYVEIPLAWPWGLRRRSLRLHLPSWWLPGETHVVHRDLGHGWFRFTMTIRHKLLGEILRHDGVFRREEADDVLRAAAARDPDHARGVR